MACPQEMPQSNTRSQRLGSIRRLSFAERTRLVEYRHARTLDRIESGAGRFVMSDGRLTLTGQCGPDGWTVTDGTEVLPAANAEEAERLADDWLRLKGPPIVKPVHRPQAEQGEAAPVSTPQKPEEAPWTPQERTPTGRTCRRVRKQQNRNLVLYTAPRRRGGSA